MNRAAKLIDAALKCAPGLESSSEIVVSCLSLLARDVCDLFDLFAEKSRWVLQEAEVGDLFDSLNEQDRQRVLDKLKSGYIQRCVFCFLFLLFIVAFLLCSSVCLFVRC